MTDASSHNVISDCMEASQIKADFSHEFSVIFADRKIWPRYRAQPLFVLYDTS